MSDTASTANNDDKSADNAADDKPNYQTENDLDFEMSEEREQEFINETLGIDNTTPPDKSDDNDKKGEGKVDDDKDDTKDNNKADPDKSADDTNEEAGKNKQDKTAGTEADKGDSSPEPPKDDKQENKAPEPIQTDDLWIEAEKAVEDKDGNVTYEKVKLTFDPENPSAFLPEDFKFKSDKQLYDILEAKAEMANLYKERQAEFDKANEEVETTKSAKQQQEDQLALWDSEIEELVDGGFLEAPKTKPGEKDWTKDESVQKIDAVFKFMQSENDKRLADGKKPIKSFTTAFNKYNKIESDKAAEAEKKAKAAEAKQKGALVGGSSSASGGTEKPYVSGSYASIHEVPVE